METWAAAVGDVEMLLQLCEDFPNHIQRDLWEMELESLRISNPELYNEGRSVWERRKK